MKKTLTMVLAFALVFALGVGGTLAWLNDSTDPVINTFSPSDINITLEESEDLDLQMVPGKTITKDPVVSVVKDSEACWLFVKIEKSANYGTFLNDYEIADGWKPLEGVEGVYCRKVDAATAAAGVSYDVLKNNQVTVKDTVTKADMTAENYTDPTLTFTAYASQLMNDKVEFTEAQAWANING